MARRSVPLACGLLLGALTVEAHQSISGMYDTRRDVRIEGVITQFEFINPHAFLMVEVRETGRVPTGRIMPQHSLCMWSEKPGAPHRASRTMRRVRGVA